MRHRSIRVFFNGKEIKLKKKKKATIRVSLVSTTFTKWCPVRERMQYSLGLCFQNEVSHIYINNQASITDENSPNILPQLRKGKKKKRD